MQLCQWGKNALFWAVEYTVHLLLVYCVCLSGLWQELESSQFKVKVSGKDAHWDTTWLPERKLSCVGYFYLIRSSCGFPIKHIV